MTVPRFCKVCLTWLDRDNLSDICSDKCAKELLVRMGKDKEKPKQPVPLSGAVKVKEQPPVAEPYPLAAPHPIGYGRKEDAIGKIIHYTGAYPPSPIQEELRTLPFPRVTVCAGVQVSIATYPETYFRPSFCFLESDALNAFVVNWIQIGNKRQFARLNESVPASLFACPFALSRITDEAVIRSLLDVIPRLDFDTCPAAIPIQIQVQNLSNETHWIHPTMLGRVAY